MKSLESRNFVATLEDIEEIAKDYATADKVQGTSRVTYLRAELATTQSELGAVVRRRMAQTAALTEDEIAAHLAALQAVHERFYPVVVKAISAGVPASKVNMPLIHRRSNFARTSYSLLRGYVKAGHDLRGLAPGRVTKGELRSAKGVSRTPKLTTLQRGTLRAAERLGTAAEALGAVDKVAAVAALEGVMTQLAAKLVAMGAAPTSNPSQAVKDHRPLRTAAGVFYPAQAARRPALRMVA